MIYKNEINVHTHIAADELIGKRVAVYYNLHKDTFSIKYKAKVVHWADSVELVNVRFFVSEKAMTRIKLDPRHKKEVHAYVIGDLVSLVSYEHKTLDQAMKHIRPPTFNYQACIKYNPLDGLPYFRNIETDERIDHAPCLIMQNFFYPVTKTMKPTIYQPLEKS
jgi:hypothetical protein